jgi:hypothetical protein
MRISGPKRKKLAGGWRKLHTEELHDLYALPSITRMISRRMRWAEHVARMGRGEMNAIFCLENQKGRDHLEDLVLDGNISD